MALLALTVMPAIAQIPPLPPPPTHEHSWAAAKPNDPPLYWQPDLQETIGEVRFNWDPITQESFYYVRCGETVECQDIGLVVDRDYCTCNIGTCSLNHEAMEWQGTVVDWSDGGVGGEFGRYDAQSQWVPMGVNCPAAQVTHYRAGDTPSVVTINCKVDDNPNAPLPPLPPLEQSGPWADDDPAWSTKAIQVTVYDLTITDTPVDWVPEGASASNRVMYTAALEPSVDHNSVPLIATINLELTARSSEPGYCINAGNETGPDLAFVQADQQDEDPETEEGNCTILSDYQAESTAPTNQARVFVSCFDYGAYGVIRAKCEDPFGTGELKARLRRGSTIYPKAEGAHIPYDYDGNDLSSGLPTNTNHIQDGWLASFGLPGLLPIDIAPAIDNDAGPIANGVAGDGLSVYEEYRGMLCRGVGSTDTHKRLLPHWKELFITAAPNFRCAGIEYPWALGVLMYTTHTVSADQQVNQNKCTGHAQKQYAVKFTKGDRGQHKYYYAEPGAMSSPSVEVEVCVNTIRSDCNDPAWNKAGLTRDAAERTYALIGLLTTLLDDEAVAQSRHSFHSYQDILSTYMPDCVLYEELPWSIAGGQLPDWVCSYHTAHWQVK